MVRGLAVLVAAFAVSARAQDARGSQAAPGPVAGERQATLASRSPPEPSPPQLPPAARPCAAGGGSLQDKLAACAAVPAYLAGTPMAVKTYHLSRAGTGYTHSDRWELPPSVHSITRCGLLYVIQVWSKSKDAWRIAQGTLETPGGVVFPATPVDFNVWGNGTSNNIIAAEAPPGLAFSKLRLHLSDRDGRVARIAVEELP